MGLLCAADEGRDGGDGDDGAARGRLGGHLTGGGLGGVEGTVEIGADGMGKEIGF